MTTLLTDLTQMEQVVTAVLREVVAPGVDAPPIFRDELQNLLESVKDSIEKLSGMNDENRVLDLEISSLRRTIGDTKREQEEFQNSVNNAADDSSRHVQEIAKVSHNIKQAEKQTTELRAKNALLESQKDLGTSWTADQIHLRETLESSRLSALGELDTRQQALLNARKHESDTAEKVEKALAQKTALDKEIVRRREEVDATRSLTALAAKKKDAKDKQVSETQLEMARVQVELREKTAQAASGAIEVAAAQHSVARDRNLLARYTKDLDKLRLHAERLTAELDDTLSTNGRLAQELEEMMMDFNFRLEAEKKNRKEAERLSRAQQKLFDEMAEIDAKSENDRVKHDSLIEELKHCDEDYENAEKEFESTQKLIDVTRREKEALQRGLEKAGDKSKAASAAVQYQKAMLNAATSEISNYVATLKNLRAQIENAIIERDKYSELAEREATAYFAASDALKFQRQQAQALEKKIEEILGKIRSQEQLHTAMKTDRMKYSRAADEAKLALLDVQKSFRDYTLRVETAKEVISARDEALVREHFEHHRVEKDLEALEAEKAKLTKQITSSETIITSQMAEAAKLNAIIAEAEEEKKTQIKEVAKVRAEQHQLAQQLVNRNAELTEIYNKLRLQKVSLASGATAYAKKMRLRNDLKKRFAELKGDLLVAEAQIQDVSTLKNEAVKLDAELTMEKCRYAFLKEEISRPLNVHRWRELAEKEPERWALIQRVHSLQKRLLELRDVIRAKDEKRLNLEGEIRRMRHAASKAPGGSDDATDALLSLQEEFKAKQKQIKEMESKVAEALIELSDKEREHARLKEEKESLVSEYVRRQQLIHTREKLIREQETETMKETQENADSLAFFTADGAPVTNTRTQAILKVVNRFDNTFGSISSLSVSNMNLDLLNLQDEDVPFASASKHGPASILDSASKSRVQSAPTSRPRPASTAAKGGLVRQVSVGQVVDENAHAIARPNNRIPLAKRPSTVTANRIAANASVNNITPVPVGTARKAAQALSANNRSIRSAQ